MQGFKLLWAFLAFVSSVSGYVSVYAFVSSVDAFACIVSSTVGIE